MKFFVYLISFILILALMGLFVLKKPTGQAWLTIDDVLPKTLMIDKEIKSITDKLSIAYENITTNKDSLTEQSNEVKIYRWKDSNGNWVYSDKLKNSVESEEVLLDPNDVIVLPAFEVSTNNSPNSYSPQKGNKASPSSLTAPPSKVLNLYKDANNVQKLMDERQHNISKAIKDSTG